MPVIKQHSPSYFGHYIIFLACFGGDIPAPTTKIGPPSECKSSSTKIIKIIRRLSQHSSASSLQDNIELCILLCCG